MASWPEWVPSRVPGLAIMTEPASGVNGAGGSAADAEAEPPAAAERRLKPTQPPIHFFQTASLSFIQAATTSSSF